MGNGYSGIEMDKKRLMVFITVEENKDSGAYGTKTAFSKSKEVLTWERLMVFINIGTIMVI